MVITNSYVSLPEGIERESHPTPCTTLPIIYGTGMELKMEVFDVTGGYECQLWSTIKVQLKPIYPLVN